jgi:two-component system NarL family sensor kinase
LNGEPMRRLPIESAQPILVFAVVRLALAVLALALALLLGLPYEGRLSSVIAGVGIPWSLFNLWLARRAPEAALNPLIAAGDVAMLAVIEAVAPETYGAVRFIALFYLAVHAHFQGERLAVLVALFAAAVLAIPTLVSDSGPVDGDLLIFYEGAFVAAALGTVALVGGFRTAESASRLQAREISRRTLLAEREIRRRVSESLHDGPLQELIGADMVLTAAGSAAAEGDAARAAGLIEEARTAVERNVHELRDEMLDLGPYAYEEFSFEAAVERCFPVWKRRYDLEGRLDAADVELPSETEGELFRITQEAVANAARHGSARHVTVTLRSEDGSVRLIVADDGKGFEGVDPLGAAEPGHIGLATMRERSELLDGELSIESTEEGTTVSVTAPLPRRRSRQSRR